MITLKSHKKLVYIVLLFAASESNGAAAVPRKFAPLHPYFHPYFKLLDGRIGPRVTESCQCEISKTLTQAKSEPYLFIPPTHEGPPVKFILKKIISRDFLGTKWGSARPGTHYDIPPVFVDHYEVTALQQRSGWLRNHYIRYVHVHEEDNMFATSVCSIATPYTLGPLQTSHFHKEWSENTPLANALLVAGAAATVIYACNYKKVNAWLKNKLAATAPPPSNGKPRP
jgi:hypothetical protein